jgi:hypothetical protein
MSFWKDAGKSFIKYSEKIVEKTEEYTKIAKLILDIKKLENSIESLHCGIGEYIIRKINEGARDIAFDDDFIRDHAQRIRDNKVLIDGKRREIEAIKTARTGPDGTSGPAKTP